MCQILGLSRAKLLCQQHRERVVGHHRAKWVLCSACVNACIFWLGVVDDQLTNVSDHHVLLHVIGPYDHPLYPTREPFLPGYLWMGLTHHITKEAGCVAHIYNLVRGAIDHDRGLRLRWDGELKERCGWVQGGWLWEGGACVRPGEVEATDHNRECDALRACLCIHVALVVVSHAIGGAGELRLPLTTVLTFTHWMTVPDDTLRPLLGAQKIGTGCFLGHSHGALLLVYITGGNTTAVPTDILAALFKGFTLLEEMRRHVTHAECCSRLQKYSSPCCFTIWNFIECLI